MWKIYISVFLAWIFIGIITYAAVLPVNQFIRTPPYQGVIISTSTNGYADASTSPTIGSITATSTTATSIFNGAMNIASSSVFIGSQNDRLNGLGISPFIPSTVNSYNPEEKTVSIFKSDSTPWVKNGTGTLSYDSSTFLFGTTSLKMVTGGAGVTLTTKWTNISPTLDLTNKRLSIWFMVSATSTLSKLWMYASSDNLVANYYTFKLQSLSYTTGNLSYIQPNQWTHVTVDLDVNNPSTSFVTTGSPNWTAINSLQISIADNSTGALTVWLGKVSLVEKMPYGVLTFTFDDGYESVWTDVMPDLAQAGIPATIFVNNALVGTENRLNLTQLTNLHRQGYEIACHGASHVNLYSAASSTVIQQLSECKNWLIANGFSDGSGSFAYPYGAQNYALQRVVGQYFHSARGTNGAWTDNLPPDNPYLVRALEIQNTTATSTIQNAIIDAANNHEWLVLFTHNATTTPTSDSTNIWIGKLQAIVNTATSTAGLKIMTYRDALALSYAKNNSVSFNNGNVGIGTTSPYAPLSVLGQVVASYFTATSSTATSTFQAVQFLGNVAGIRLDEIENPLTSVSFNFGNNKTLDFSSVDTTPLAGEGVFNFQASGAFSGDLVHIHQHTGNPGFSHLLHLESSDPDVSNLYVDGTSTTTALFMGVGNVGISTTSPYRKLSVSGNGIFEGNLIADTFTATNTAATSTLSGGLDVGINKGFAVDMAAAANTLHVTAAGRVAIGSANPSVKLHVQTTDSSTFYLDRVGAGGNTWGWLISSSHLLFKDVTNNKTPFTIQANTPTDTLYLTSAGRVGMGTSSPAAKLSVEQGSATTIGQYIAGFKNSTADLFRISTTSTATSTAFVIDSKGRVGIGTTTPTFPLSVQGQALADDWLTYSDIYTGDALTALKGIKSTGGSGDWKGVDHSSLPQGVLKEVPLTHYESYYKKIETHNERTELITTESGDKKEMPVDSITVTYKRISDGITLSETQYNTLKESEKGRTVQDGKEQFMSISGLTLVNTQAIIQLEQKIADMQKQIDELKAVKVFGAKSGVEFIDSGFWQKLWVVIKFLFK